MSGAKPRLSEPGSRSRSGALTRAAVVSGVVLILGSGVYLGVASRRRPAVLEQVGRDRLVLRESRWMKTDETNAFTGVMVDFYPDGTMQSRTVLSNGWLNGLSEGWWTNGVLAVRETFVEGRSHGVRTKWDMAGNRIAETEIRLGQIEGFHREWHTNGQPSVEVSMAAGKPHGVSKKWTPEGVLAGRWVLSNGVVQQAMTNTAELQSLAQKGGAL